MHSLLPTSLLTPACHGLQALPLHPLHASSAAALLNSSTPSAPSSAAFPYVAVLCCISLSHYVLEVPGGHALCATLHAGDREECAMCAVGDGCDALYAALYW